MFAYRRISLKLLLKNEKNPVRAEFLPSEFISWLEATNFTSRKYR